MHFQFKMPEIFKYTFWPFSKADHNLVGRDVYLPKRQRAVGFYSLQCRETQVVVEARLK